jgi:putative Holliday junction resolvase
MPGTAPRLILAFDLGLRRIGVAHGDTLTRTAAPLKTLPSGPQGPPWERIHGLVRDWQPALAVVGLPYNADGSESAMAAAARGFAEELGRRCTLAVTLVDERYSSLEAQTRLRAARESGLRKRRVAKADVDAAAACVILERWFSTT